MPFQIVSKDILSIRTDAVVVSADCCSQTNSDYGRRVYDAAGSLLLKARQEIGVLQPGEATVTPAFELPAKIIIHTAVPDRLENEEDKELLFTCYRECLSLASGHKCRSVVFPLLGAGKHGFSSVTAREIAENTFRGFLMDHSMKIILAVPDRQSVEIPQELFQNVAGYIEKHFIPEDQELCSMAVMPDMEVESCSEVYAGGVDWENLLRQRDAGFSETLVDLIEKSGKKNSEIYHKANVDKKLFSKIINHINYHPSKQTAVAFAIALELDLDQTQDLLSRAGYTLSHSSKFDIIIEYFITAKNYDIFEINEVLFRFDQSLLGV